MHIDRARQIMKAPDTIEVLYQGSPVWIKKINNENATVNYLETGSSIEVPIETLLEKRILG